MITYEVEANVTLVEYISTDATDADEAEMLAKDYAQDIYGTDLVKFDVVSVKEVN